MSDTATAAKQPTAQPIAQPIEKVGFFRRLGRRIKSYAKRVGSFIVRCAKALGRGSKTAGKHAATGTYAGTLHLGFGATWLVGAVLSAVIVALTLVTSIGWVLAGLIVGGVLYALAGVTSIWDTWVVGVFRWLKYRRHHKISFREYRLHRKAEQEQKVDSWKKQLTDSALGMFHINEDDIIVPDSLSDLGLTTLEVRTKDALEIKTRHRIQADQDNTEESFPGANANQVTSEDPYSEPGTMYEPKNPLLKFMGDWLGRHPDKTAVQFRFENGWGVYDQVEALRQLVSASTDIRERSYWRGRLGAIEEIGFDDKRLEEHGRAWTMLFHHNRNRQSEVSLRLLRAGFMDMVEDLKVQRDKRARKPVA